MNDLEAIKRIEEEVAALIDKAKKDSERSILEAKSGATSVVKSRVSEVKVEMETKMKAAEVEIQKEADEIIKKGKSEVAERVKAASKRRSDAVKFVIKEFIGG